MVLPTPLNAKAAGKPSLLSPRQDGGEWPDDETPRVPRAADDNSLGYSLSAAVASDPSRAAQVLPPGVAQEGLVTLLRRPGMQLVMSGAAKVLSAALRSDDDALHENAEGKPYWCVETGAHRSVRSKVEAIGNATLLELFDVRVFDASSAPCTAPDPASPGGSSTGTRTPGARRATTPHPARCRSASHPARCHPSTPPLFSTRALTGALARR